MRMSGIAGIERMIQDFAGAAQSMIILYTFLGIAVVVLTYFIHGYVIMCTGRKAGLQKDFMPFLPIARQLYQMQIADCPWWYVFFFSTTMITVGTFSLVSFLILKLTGKMSIITVLLIIYIIANMVFTFLYYRQYYQAFGFNPNTAWMNIVPSFGLVALTFSVLIALSNAIRYGAYTPPQPVKDEELPINRGVIVGIEGVYKNASFEIVDGATIVFGRSPQESNIVFDQLATDVSRKHCTARFDGRTNQYTVTDFSSNGTFLENGTQLESGQPKQLARGTVIYLGTSRKNGFRLN